METRFLAETETVIEYSTPVLGWAENVTETETLCGLVKIYQSFHKLWNPVFFLALYLTGYSIIRLGI